jgi:DNA-binding protein HU-beta
MTRTDIIESMRKKTGMTRAQCATACDAFINVIGDALEKHERVTFTRVGTLVPHQQKVRKARHPSTKKMITIPSRCTVKFRPSHHLLEKLND